MRPPSPITISCFLLLLCLLYWTSKTSTDALYAKDYVSEKGSAIYHKLTGNPYTPADKDEFSDEDFVRPGELEITTPEIAYTGLKKTYPAKFPRIIWQTANDQEKLANADATAKWSRIKLFETKILSAKDMDQFVAEHFSKTPSIPAFWHRLHSNVLRETFFRYLVMLTEGGIVTTIGNYPVIHPDRFIPVGLGAQTINAILGLAYDGKADADHSRPILFCTDTLFSKPDHPVFDIVVQRSMSNLEYIVHTQEKVLEELELNDKERSAAIGSGVLTDVVMQVLKDQGQDVTYEKLHNLKTPTLFGDILILPVSGFASPVEHYIDPDSLDPGYNEVYIDWPRDKAKVSVGQKEAVPSKINNTPATNTTVPNGHV